MVASTIRYDSERHRFIVKVVPQYMGMVMRLPMRRYMSKLGVWIVPATRLNCEELLRNKSAFNWDGEALGVAEQAAKKDDAGRAWPIWYRHRDPQPFKHQLTACHLGYAHDEYFFSMEQGTCKTKVAIDIACVHRLHSKIEVLVVICPLSVTRTWEDELAKHCPLPYVVEYGSSAFKGITVPAEKLGAILVGVESFSQGRTAETLLAWGRLHDFMIVMDEAHNIKTHDSNRTREITKLGRLAKVRICMTGTPITKNLIDLYAQYEFLNTNIIGVGDFYAFRNRYAIMGGFKNKQVIGYDNVDELMGFLQPYTYSITKAECFDLPPKVYTRRYVDLPKAHRKLYDQLRKNELEDLEVKNSLEKALRLAQLTGGFLPGEDGKPVMQVSAEDNAKLKILREELEIAPGSVIIFARYLPEVALIKSILPPDDTVVFIGEVDIDERQTMIHQFQDGEKKYFLATIQAGGIGITLTRAQTVLYYSTTDNYAQRAQSEDRAHRAGTVHTVTYIDIIANRTSDETLHAAHSCKQDLADFLREQMQSGRRDDLI